MKSIFYTLLWLLYFPIHSLQALPLSNELLTWAEQNPIVKVGIEQNFPPFDYLDHHGNPAGDGELIRQSLSEVLPITLTVTSTGQFAEQVDHLAEKEIDLISICAETPERAKWMRFSKPFLSLTQVVVVRNDSGYNTSKDIEKSALIAVPKGYASIDVALRLMTDKVNIMEVENSYVGVSMVDSGQVKAFVTYLGASHYLTQQHGFNDVQVLPILGLKPIPLGFCVDQDKPQLVAILNAGIDALGEDYFAEIQNKWRTLVNYTDNKFKKTQLPVLKTFIVSAVIVCLLMLLMNRYAQALASKLETVKFRSIYFFILLLIISTLVVSLEYYFERFKERIIEDQKESFALTKDMSKKALDDWYLPRLEVLKEIVRADLFQEHVEQLVNNFKSDNQALKEARLAWLKTFFNAREKISEKNRQYEIIALDSQILLSSRDKANKYSTIKKRYPELFDRALNGESVFIPPINIVGSPTPVVFIVEPVIGNNGKVVALIAVSFNANRSFSDIFKDIRLGMTVESYGVDKNGYLLSESRFVEQLQQDGLLLLGESAILQVRIADSNNSPIFAALPTQASGLNLSGYEDYMGYTVVGQWGWLDTYNFMLVSEVSIDEMYLEYNELRNILSIALIIFSALIMLISLFMLLISHRAHQLNRLSKQKLEELVADRTQALIRTQKGNSLIVDSVADGILGLDIVGDIVFFNRAAEKILGYQEQEVLLKKVQDVLYFCHSADGSDFDNQGKQKIQQCLMNGENIQVETDYFCAQDGTAIPVSYNMSIIADENAPFRAVITFQDISLRILESERTKAIFANLPVAIFLLNMNKKVIDVNTAGANLLGYSQEEIIGKNLVEFVPQDRHTEHLFGMERYFNAPKLERVGHNSSVTAQKKSGEVIELEAILSTIELNGERIAIFSGTDITQANQTKKLLIEAKELADEASLSKSNFLANMSHEIRTPMNAIIGMSMLALQGTLARKERNYINKVHSSASNLLGILNDILDFSKIEAGQLSLEKQVFSFIDIIDNFSTLIGLKAKQKCVDMMFDIDHDVPLLLKGDLLRLNQILINLGGNAIKFTDSGEILFKTSVLELNDNSIKLQFSIKDSGIGIPPEQLKGLFSPFSQADASTTRKYGGTGLGLSISKRLVKLMGGDIWVESKAEQGSEFFFTVWLEVGNKHSPVSTYQTMQSRLIGKCILVVDNSLMPLALLKELLESFGCNVFSAHSGQQALQMAANIPHIDFALVEWAMPEMNGLQTCKALQTEHSGHIDHVILISDYGREAIRGSDYIDCVDGFLSKPITAKRLQHVLQAALSHHIDSEVQGDIDSTMVTRSLAGAHLLLVEDNELNQELATALLEAEGVTVSHAAQGEIAVEMAKQHCYDGILMDIQMPVMDGYKATKLIRAFDQSIPILAMTANVMAGEKEKVLAAGMNDYISKPIQVKSMFAVIHNWIKVDSSAGNETYDSSIGGLPHTQSKKTMLNTNAYFSHFNAIDVQAGLAVCNDNEALYKKLLTKFEAANKYFEVDFMRLWDMQLWEGLTRLVHTLKGSAGNIGANLLYKLLSELEQACAAPEHQVSTLFEAVKGELAKVMQELALMFEISAHGKTEHEGNSYKNNDLSNNVQQTEPSQPLSQMLSQIKQLQSLIDECDTRGQDVAMELSENILDEKIKTGFEKIIAQLEEFDFDGANQTLSKLKKDSGEQEFKND